jgi:hypothetical protein
LQVFNKRPDNAVKINAFMLVESRILGGDKGIDQFLGNFIERSDNPTFLKKLGNLTVVIRIDGGDDGRVGDIRLKN